MGQVEEAAESAQIKRFIEQQPEGWSSKVGAVGEEGEEMSTLNKASVSLGYRNCFLKCGCCVFIF